MQDLDHQQRLFMVASDQLYRAWIDGLRHARGDRYGIRWTTAKRRPVSRPPALRTRQ